MAALKKRTLIEGPLFAAGKAALGLEVERLDEVLDGVLFKISVEPTRYPFAPGLEVRRLRTQAFPPHIPALAIWYRFDSETVTLELIERWIDDDAPQDAER